MHEKDAFFSGHLSQEDLTNKFKTTTKIGEDIKLKRYNQTFKCFSTIYNHTFPTNCN